MSHVWTVTGVINCILCTLLFFSERTFADDRRAFMAIHDNAFEIELLLYGDITKMDHMFLPPLDNETSESEVDEESIEEGENARQYIFDYLDVTERYPEIREFNDITKDVNNATRRWYGKFAGYEDPEDPKWWKSANIDGENDKKVKMQSMNLQWVIHARYQIKKVLIKKNELRTDKRYRIGYLTNRLKQLKFEQQKILGYAVEQDKAQYRSLQSLLRLYERMVRYDIDIKDTVKWIRDIDKEKEKPVTRDQFTPAGPIGRMLKDSQNRRP